MARSTRRASRISRLASRRSSIAPRIASQHSTSRWSSCSRRISAVSSTWRDCSNTAASVGGRLREPLNASDEVLEQCPSSLLCVRAVRHRGAPWSYGATLPRHTPPAPRDPGRRARSIRRLARSAVASSRRRFHELHAARGRGLDARAAHGRAGERPRSSTRLKRRGRLAPPPPAPVRDATARGRTFGLRFWVFTHWPKFL